MNYSEILQIQWWGNSVQQYALSFAIFITLLIVCKVFETHIVHHLKKLSETTDTDVDDTVVRVLDEIPLLFFMVVAIYYPITLLNVPAIVDKVASAIFIIALVVQAVISTSKLLEFFARKLLFKNEKEAAKNVTIFNGFKLIAEIAIWSIGIILILSNLGVDVSSLVASLGIGGVALALASQKVLGDMFSSFSIFIDKPFEVGDMIKVGNDMGSVKKIGLKTTRIQTLDGQELVIGNEELTSSRIHNFKKMKRRRIRFTLGVTYDTPSRKLRKIPEMLTEMFETEEGATLDRVHFKSFNDSSLDFEIVYHVESQDYAEYMDIQQRVNLDIVDTFNKAKIEFAFPSRTVYLQK